MNFWRNLREHPRSAARVCWTLSMCAFVLGAVGLFLDVKAMFITALVLLALSMIVLPRVLWRCPFCGSPLPTRGMIRTEKCPYCKKKLP